MDSLDCLQNDKRVQRVLACMVVQSKQISVCRMHLTTIELPVLGGTADGSDVRCQYNMMLSLS
jgi:hypothetical protein